MFPVSGSRLPVAKCRFRRSSISVPRKLRFLFWLHCSAVFVFVVNQRIAPCFLGCASPRIAAASQKAFSPYSSVLIRIIPPVLLSVACAGVSIACPPRPFADLHPPRQCAAFQSRPSVFVRVRPCRSVWAAVLLSVARIRDSAISSLIIHLSSFIWRGSLRKTCRCRPCCPARLRAVRRR